MPMLSTVLTPPQRKKSPSVERIRKILTLDLENWRDVKPLTDPDNDHTDLKVKGVAGKGSNILSFQRFLLPSHRVNIKLVSRILIS